MKNLIVWLNSIINKHKALKRWKRVVTVLAAIMTFATTYALILPAITVEKDETDLVAGMYLEEASELVGAGEDALEGDALVPTAFVIAADQANAVTYTYEDEDIYAELVISTEEELPEATELVVNYVDSESVEYADLSSRAMSLLSREFISETTSCSFYDFALISDNVDVTPETGVADIRIFFHNNTVVHTDDALFVGKFALPLASEGGLVPMSVEELDIQDGLINDNDEEAFSDEMPVDETAPEDELLSANGDETPILDLKDGIITSLSLKGCDLARDDSVIGILAGFVDEELKAAAEESEMILSASEDVEGDEDLSDAEMPENVEEEDVTSASSAGTLTASGKDYTVKLSYDATSGVPHGAGLEVSEIAQDSKEYRTYLEETKKAMGLTEEEALPQYAARFFDIKIMVDGEEFIPKSGVTVEIAYTEPLASIPETEVSAVHFQDETSEPEVIDASATDVAKDGTATVEFTAESFSVYGVIYTVDFYWEVDGKEYTFSIPGGGYVSFEALMEVLGIAESTPEEEKNGANDSRNDEMSDENEGANNRTGLISIEDVNISNKTRKFVSDVEKVEFSNPNLVWVGKVDEDSTVGEIKSANELECWYSAVLTKEQIDEINAQTVEAGDWVLISVRPFISKETLTVTMKNGEVFIVKVSDAQRIGNALDGKSYVIKNQVSNAYAMTAPGFNYANKNYMSAEPVDDTNSQIWIFEYVNAGGCYRIKSALNGKYLAIDGNDGKGLSLADNDANGAYLYVEEGNGEYSFYYQNQGQKYYINFYNDGGDGKNFTINSEAEVNNNPSRHDITFVLKELEPALNVPRNNWLLYLDEDKTEITINVGDSLTLRPYGEWYWKNGDQPNDLRDGRWIFDDTFTTTTVYNEYVNDARQRITYISKATANNGTVEFNGYPKWDSEVKELYPVLHGVANHAGDFVLKTNKGKTITVHVVDSGATHPAVVQHTESITVNLFDYDRDGVLDPSNENNNIVGNIDNRSINAYNNYLKFLSSGRGQQANYWPNTNQPINAYTNEDSNQGIVDNNMILDSDGKYYPRLARRFGYGSLKYLFNTAQTSWTNDGAMIAYPDVKGLFQKDSQGYYYFNSNSDYAYYNGSKIVLYDHTYTQQSGNGKENAKPIGFFPFHEYNPTGDLTVNNNKNLNHHLGMSMQVKFALPAEKLNNERHITYEFTGDDDLWVFVDNRLVLDIGGIHQPVRGYIDFTDGTVFVYDQNGSIIKTDTFVRDLTTGDQHTLDMFYLERGGCDSNLAVRFNLPIVKDLTVAKRVNGLTAAERTKYLNDEFLYELGFAHNSEGFDVDLADDDAVWNDQSWRSHFSLYQTKSSTTDETKNNTVYHSRNGDIKGYYVNNGQIWLKDGESFSILQLPNTDFFYLAEENQLDMQQFETPHAERIYYNEEEEKDYEEEVHLHEDSAVYDSKSDWETKPYALMDTERLVYTNTLQEKNLDVEKLWNDIFTNHHGNDPITFKLKAWVKNGTEYQSYSAFMNSVYGNDYSNINAQWTETTVDNNVAGTTTYTGNVLNRTFELNDENGWKISFEHLPKMTPSANDTGKEIFYTVEEVTQKDGYSTTVSPAMETDKVYLDLYKFWPDGNDKHDGHSEIIDDKLVEYPMEHITTYVKRSDGKYLIADRADNGEYVYTGITDSLSSATQFELVSKNQLPSVLQTTDQKDMFDYAARIRDVPVTVGGNSYTYMYDEEVDEDETTTGLVMFTRPKQDIKIQNDTSVLTVEKEWLDSEGNALEHHPSSIEFDVYRSYHVHSWSSWAASGSRETRSCQYEGCTATETRTIDDGGHDFVKMSTVEPTCDTQGYDLYICSKDPTHTEQRNPVPALGHQWKVREQADVVIEPTCTDEGLRKYTCQREGCNHIVLETIAATGHTWGNWVYTKQPTETENGEIKRTCSICGEEDIREIEYGADFPTDPDEPPTVLPDSPVPYIPEALQSLNDPENGNFVEIYKYGEELETGDDSSTIVTGSNPTCWAKDYAYPAHDENQNEYTYYVYETSPGSGYKTTYTYYDGIYDEAQGKVKYTMKSTGDLQNYDKVHISNTQDIEIELYKTSDTGVPLAGAVFKLFYKKNITSDSFTVVPTKSPGANVTGTTFAPLNQSEAITFGTGESLNTFTIPGGGIKISGLKEGLYKLEEFKAPNGYVITNKEVYIKITSGENAVINMSLVDKDGNNLSEEAASLVSLESGVLGVKNQPGAALPNTGGSGTDILYITGCILTVLAGVGIVMKRRKRAAA